MREPSVLGLKPTGVHHLTQALLGKGLEVIIHVPARDEGGTAARGLMDVLSGTLGASALWDARERTSP